MSVPSTSLSVNAGMKISNEKRINVLHLDTDR